jgi:Tfp pilus assembly protein PilO
MTKLRQMWLLTALGSLAALAGGYFLLVSPQASKAAGLRNEAETQQQANAKLTSQIKMLNAQKKDLPAQQAELAKFASKIPSNPAMPALIRSVSDAADNAGVELRSLSPSQPVLVTAGTGRNATAVTATAPYGMALAQIPVSIKVVGNYSQVSQFLSEVEGLPRAFLVSGLAVKPGAEAPQGADSAAAATTADSDLLTADLTGQLYMTTKVAAPVAPKTATTAASTTAAK